MFVSDRDGPFDLWMTQVGSRVFRNRTEGNDCCCQHQKWRLLWRQLANLARRGDPSKRMRIMPPRDPVFVSDVDGANARQIKSVLHAMTH